MSAITTHVLDTSVGKPAAGVPVLLEQETFAGWQKVGHGVTDADGRLRDLLPEGYSLAPGCYQITFDTGIYFEAQEREAFYNSVMVRFTVRDLGEHYHVPLLLSPFGYSTYRGS